MSCFNPNQIEPRFCFAKSRTDQGGVKKMTWVIVTDTNEILNSMTPFMTSNKNNSGRLLSFLVAALLVLVVAPLRAELPPEAQAALNKGIMAAKQQEWEIAIRSFQEARKTAPDAPEVFYNLGLAESKMPGRELRAIAWFGAYLSATTNAPNAAAVKDKIAELQIKNEGNTSRLIKQMQDAASQMEWGSRNGGLSYVAYLWADAGDILAALKTVDLMEDRDKDGMVKEGIASTQARNGDITGAQKTANLIQHGENSSHAQRTIAEAQIKAGDIAGAQKTLASAQKNADLEKDAYSKSRSRSLIAKAQIKAGDTAGAQKTLASAQKAAEFIKHATWKNGAQQDISDAAKAIAEAQATSGDIAGAQKTAALIKDASYKRYAQAVIAEAQAAGIIITPNSTRQSTSDTQPSIQPVITVSDWLKKLDDDLNTEPFLDLTGYLKSLPPSDKLWNVFESLLKTAQKIVTAQNVIHKMLKPQTAQPSKP